MNELEAIVAAANAAQDAGRSALLATVVRVRGSAYRRPGARMLVTEEGWRAGSISGGCLEGDILRKAWWRTRDGGAVVVTYDSTLEDEEDALSWSFGLGCNGIVDVLLERLTPAAPGNPVAFFDACLSARRSGRIATVIAAPADPSLIGCRLLWREGDLEPCGSSLPDGELARRIAADTERALAAGAGSTVATYADVAGGVDVFCERIAPPTPLVICGAGHDAAPLAAMAKSLGWHVTVVDPRPGALPRPDRFPGADAVIACPPADLPAHVALDARTLAVIMSHNVPLDAGLLAALLPSPVRYIGLLGPRRRTEMLLATVKAEGVAVSQAAEGRVHGPVGLDLGTDGPETIALSILAEMQAATAGGSGAHLRDLDRPIHNPATATPYGAIPTAIRETVTCALISPTTPASAS